MFDLYQGKGVGQYHGDNVAAVGAAAATLLDLVDLLPRGEEEPALPFLWGQLLLLHEADR